MTLAPVTPAVDFEPQVSVPRGLHGIVDHIFELRSGPAQHLVMPWGKVELIFFLDDSSVNEFFLGEDSESERTPGRDKAFLFCAANRPISVAARPLHLVLAQMNPAAATLLFGIPASELRNRSIPPAALGIDISGVHEQLNQAQTFQQRSDILGSWLRRRLGTQAAPPRFLSYSSRVTDIFANGGVVPYTEQVLDLTGYSAAQANRLSKQWLGVSVERHASLLRFRKALALLNSPMDLAQVAAEAGYFDQAHFTRTFSKFSGMSPGQYRRTPRTGADTLHIRQVG
ncbi:MAG: hypothetical protein CBC58_03270 [Cellulomonadaceae bacterium TMED98]|nr:MAG: hypothetical protein CBC58_03270 [Cellulomonadaceae bacterium TMED98]CAI8352382.1 MAG: HTH-type transcriptional activator Btr [Cellulomonadaceae bacterium TMED98]